MILNLSIKGVFSVFLLFFLHQLSAQENNSIHATGGNATSNMGQVSFSIGVVAYDIKSSNGGEEIYEGVQQPPQLEVSTFIKGPEGVQGKIMVYPNPVKIDLNLKLDREVFPDASWVLFDLQGRILKRAGISASITRINMSGYAPGRYFLKIVNEEKILRTFEIIKR